MQQKSITFRLTALFAGLSSTVLLLLGVLVGSLVEQHFQELDMEVLKGKLELVRHTMGRAPSGDRLDVLARQLDDALIGHHGLAVTVVADGGQVLFRQGDVNFPAALLQDGIRRDMVRPMIWSAENGVRYRGIAAAVGFGPGDASSAVVGLAIDLSHHEHFMRSFRMALWAVVIFAALLTGFLGWVAVRRGLAPLQAMRLGAAAVTAHRLDFRLAEEAVPVELAALARSLNEMLARLEESFRRLSDFSSDLAHELRTPVSNLLTQTQVTLSRTRTAEEYRDVLASNSEELERMARMISDMLFLAKAENGLIVPERCAVDLAAEVRGLFDFYEALAEEKQISLRLEGEGSTHGDRLMLRRALSNLLSNAIRHTPAAGRVLVRICGSSEGTISVGVLNSGEPIAAEHIPRLFDRFYRADPSRQRTGEEAGLGLAITRSIVVAHGGEITARSEGEMTVFSIRLPVA